MEKNIIIVIIEDELSKVLNFKVENRKANHKSGVRIVLEKVLKRKISE